MKNITDEQKIYELSKIWKEAAYNFAFWDKVDIDWDEEYRKTLVRVLETKDIYDYYNELSRFVALLGDGHTSVSFPRRWCKTLNISRCFLSICINLTIK